VGRDAPADDPIGLFGDGRLAMMHGDDRLLSRLVGRQGDWALAPEPVDPKRPDEGTSFRYLNYMGISSTAAHGDQAWKIAKMLSGGENARTVPGTGIPIRRPEAALLFGKLDLSAFYALRPERPVTSGKEPQGLNPEFYLDFYAEGERLAKEAASGKTDVGKALSELEGFGRALIRKGSYG